MLDDRDHGHPVLARPISFDQLIDEVSTFLPRYLIACRGQDPLVEIDPGLTKLHQRNARRYAQVYPESLCFQFAEQTLWLPKANRIALIAHEIGHLIDTGSEASADRAAWRVLGIRIAYDKRWPGKGLQSVAHDLGA